MRQRAAVLAVAVLVVLGADVAVVVTRRTETPSGPTPAAVGEVERAIPELMAFVEQARGLRFKQKPVVQLLPDREFEQRLLEDDAADEESLADDEAYLGLLRALGLVEGDLDLDEVSEEQAHDIVGFYDAHADTLFVRGTTLTPYVKEVLVHELTHALEDQLFDLDRESLNDDDAAAFAALVEGSALVVEKRWFDSRPPAEQEEIEAAEGSGDPEGVTLPGQDVFDQLLSFPYEVGPRFVDAVLAAGQQSRLDEAFRVPPVTSEQVLHPERFLAGEGARPVADPSPDGPEIERGSLGELGLLLVVDGAVEHGSALRAAAGWGGDRYVLWKDGARSCLRWNLVMDTARDTNEALAALRAWAGDHRGASVRGLDPIVVTSCG